MIVVPTLADRFRWIHLFRRNGAPNQILRVLEDTDGWLYVLKLAGTMDFGPYTKGEIVLAFDVEPEPCGTRAFETKSVNKGEGSAANDGDDQ